MATRQNGSNVETTFPAIIELNVGGVYYSTSLSTLIGDPKSKLSQLFATPIPEGSELSLLKDSKGKYFIDRDGVLFRYILDFLRNKKLVLPDNFHETKRLHQEAEYFQLLSLIEILDNSSDAGHEAPELVPTRAQLEMHRNSLPASVCVINPHHPRIAMRTASMAAYTTPCMESITTASRPSATDLTCIPGGPGTLVIGYRGTFAFGRDGLADVKFRKLTRILVHGRVNLCREVFGDTLNESRDPDRGTNIDRYTARFFLKHTSLEQAFDSLLDAGFYLAGCCGTGTSNAVQGNEMKPGMDTEENRWNHYNEFVFVRN